MEGRCTIDGTILQTIFTNEENGYTVLRLVTTDGEVVTVVGTIPCAASGENLIVREKGSGTRMLLEQAIASRGYSLDSFHRCSAISNFSVICELVGMEQAITFAYEPVSHCRSDLATFHVEDMQITGEFNLVYINRSVAEPKAAVFFCDQQ